MAVDRLDSSRANLRLGLALAVLLFTLPSLATAATCEVGSFTKTTSGAPASQIVSHGLGETPKLVFLWTGHATGSSWATNFRLGFGASDGTVERSIASGSQDNVGTTNTSRRIADKVLTIVEWGQVTVAEADLTSWNSTSFTINWTTNDATASVIHYMVLGGSDVSADVASWTVSGSTGNRSITGVGFRPTVVLFIYAGLLTSSVPGSQQNAACGMGAMDASGDQWALSGFSEDAVGDSYSKRAQRTNACIHHETDISFTASFVSMDSDGYTVNFSSVQSGSQIMAVSLAGMNAKAGFFNKSTSGAPASQSITISEFRPTLLLLTSFQNVTSGSVLDHMRFGFGMTDGTNEGATALTDGHNVGTSVVDSIDSTSKVFIKANNSTATTDAQADLTSFDTNGFTLNWTTNDAVATEILYLALTPFSAMEIRLAEASATATAAGVALEWRTDMELDNLGFHVLRDDGGGPQRLTRQPIPSALLAPGVQTTTGGARYAWLDPSGSERSTYWIEDLDLSGATERHGPIYPVPTLTTTGVSPLVSPGGPTPSFPSAASSSGSAWPRLERTASPASTAISEWVQQGLASSPGLEIEIDTEGWVRIERDVLVGAGLDPAVDPRNLQLFTSGRDVALEVTGELDGRFDTGDSVSFYGWPSDTPWSGARVYWLIESSGLGRRVMLTSGSLPVAQAAAFPTIRELRERSVYFAALLDGEDSNILGPMVTALPLERDLSFPDAIPQGVPPQLEVRLRGLTLGDHEVGVWLGGGPIPSSLVGTLTFQGRELGSATFDLDPGLLAIPTLQLRLESMSFADISLVESLRIRYSQAFVAEANSLSFELDGGTVAVLDGFDVGSPLRAFDVTDPFEAREITIRGSTAPASSSSASTLVTPAGAARKILAVTEQGEIEPRRVSAATPSRWHQAQTGGRWIAIGPSHLLPAIQPLADLRANQGWCPVIVDIDDLYDEWSYGEKSPHAIRAFLADAAARWDVAPEAVLLIGDATYDPRNFLGGTRVDDLPTRLVDTRLLEAASDSWYSDIDGDGLDDLSIGRLPASDESSLQRWVRRIVSYNPLAAAQGPLDVLFLADNSEDFNYTDALEVVRDALQPPFVHELLSLDDFSLDKTRSLLFARLDAGVGLVAYLGHGGLGAWASEPLLSREDVRELRNDERLPIVLSFSCFNGYFQHGNADALAEAWVHANDGGAIAVCAPTGAIGPVAQVQLASSFFRAYSNPKYETLGEVVRHARAQLDDPDLRSTWTLFGDPALPLRP
ncbi:MAG: C25 family cysteine peptidase [Planctomycetota bacterium]